MITYVKGYLTSKNPAQVTVECNGIGYSLLISLNTYSKIADLNEAQLFIESVFVRDDNPRYYGFADEEERDLFRKIISVSGVGGSSAILMLSSMSAADIAGAINTANVAALKSIKGIGE
ncbi:MAG: Holliday junction branch migration protein RuvA, partial [Bacteroidia bacterium]|nr:Holliday junction branch migration protein RuvA [Bacteroidia bacterium]